VLVRTAPAWDIPHTLTPSRTEKSRLFKGLAVRPGRQVRAMGLAKSAGGMVPTHDMGQSPAG
jgi:hypothetical protein